MLRTNVYLTEDQYRELKRRAIIGNKAKAAVLREVIDKGLEVTKAQKSASAEGFLKLAELGQRFKGIAPKDLSVNHDKYTWDE